MRFVTYLSTVTKISEKSVMTQCPLHHWSNHFGVMHYVEVQKIFTIWTSWASKDATFYVDFTNINLP
jgi:hypothetical protein